MIPSPSTMLISDGLYLRWFVISEGILNPNINFGTGRGGETYDFMVAHFILHGIVSRPRYQDKQMT